MLKPIVGIQNLPIQKTLFLSHQVLSLSLSLVKEKLGYEKATFNTESQALFFQN
jgi:hypothetical protein